MRNIIYTIHGTIDFGEKFLGVKISKLLDSPEGRNYLVWMWKDAEGFKFGAKLALEINKIIKTNEDKNGKGKYYEYSNKVS